MPIYEYLCPQCREIFEEWTKSAGDDTVEPCPRCGAAASKVMSQTSFVLKGDGWYVSDYGYRKNIKEEGEASKTVGSETDTKIGDKAAKDVGQEAAKTGGSSGAAADVSVPITDRADAPKTADKSKTAGPAPRQAATPQASGAEQQARDD
ncbi:MAG: zinc ribbon domain-containing protein [Desulfovibrio sp.]|jgi:putative FmdB family regulatory protein|nr:zinc ribbon domain-containing protein [Desulfovibrio sp.]